VTPSAPAQVSTPRSYADRRAGMGEVTKPATHASSKSYAQLTIREALRNAAGFINPDITSRVVAMSDK
jgi:hypothetical protein